MESKLAAGRKAQLTFIVTDDKTVPHLYPESADFRSMPGVFATGFMVGLMEWACLELLKPYLGPGEGSLGIHINVSHIAATLPGQTVTVNVRCTAVSGRRVSFEVVAHDGIEKIGEGTHERMIVPWDVFKSRVAAKAKAAGVAPLG